MEQSFGFVIRPSNSASLGFFSAGSSVSSTVTMDWPASCTVTGLTEAKELQNKL